MTTDQAGPGFVRGRKSSFTVVQDDDFIEGMSARAWGIYCYLVGKPEGWECRVYDLARHFKEGRDALYTAIAELVELGLLTKEAYYDKNLRRFRYRLDDRETTPQTRRSAPETDYQDPETPGTGTPDTEGADAENPPLVSKEVTTMELQRKDSDTPPAGGADDEDPEDLLLADPAVAGPDGSTATSGGRTAEHQAALDQARISVQWFMDTWQAQNGGHPIPESSRVFNALVGAGRTPGSAQYVTAALLAGATAQHVEQVLGGWGREGRGLIPPKAEWTERLAAVRSGKVVSIGGHRGGRGPSRPAITSDADRDARAAAMKAAFE